MNSKQITWEWLYTERQEDSPVTRTLIKMQSEVLVSYKKRVLAYQGMYLSPKVQGKEREFKKALRALIELAKEKGVDIPHLEILISRGMRLPPILQEWEEVILEGIQFYHTGECWYWKPTEKDEKEAEEKVRQIVINKLESLLKAH